MKHISTPLVYEEINNLPVSAEIITTDSMEETLTGIDETLDTLANVLSDVEFNLDVVTTQYLVAQLSTIITKFGGKVTKSERPNEIIISFTLTDDDIEYGLNTVSFANNLMNLYGGDIQIAFSGNPIVSDDGKTATYDEAGEYSVTIAANSAGLLVDLPVKTTQATGVVDDELTEDRDVTVESQQIVYQFDQELISVAPPDDSDKIVVQYMPGNDNSNWQDIDEDEEDDYLSLDQLSALCKAAKDATVQTPSHEDDEDYEEPVLTDEEKGPSLFSQIQTKIAEINSQNDRPLSTITFDSLDEIDGLDQLRICTLRIPASIETIPEGFLSSAFNLSTLTLVNSKDSQLTSIGANAFHDCVHLTSLICPNSLVEIQDGAFAGATGLQIIVLNQVSSCNVDACFGTVSNTCAIDSTFHNIKNGLDLEPIFDDDYTLMSRRVTFAAKAVDPIADDPYCDWQSNSRDHYTSLSVLSASTVQDVKNSLQEELSWTSNLVLSFGKIVLATGMGILETLGLVEGGKEMTKLERQLDEAAREGIDDDESVKIAVDNLKKARRSGKSQLIKRREAQLKQARSTVYRTRLAEYKQRAATMIASLGCAFDDIATQWKWEQNFVVKYLEGNNETDSSLLINCIFNTAYLPVWIGKGVCDTVKGWCGEKQDGKIRSEKKAQEATYEYCHDRTESVFEYVKNELCEGAKQRFLPVEVQRKWNMRKQKGFWASLGSAIWDGVTYVFTLKFLGTLLDVAIQLIETASEKIIFDLLRATRVVKYTLFGNLTGKYSSSFVVGKTPTKICENRWTTDDGEELYHKKHLEHCGDEKFSEPYTTDLSRTWKFTMPELRQAAGNSSDIKWDLIEDNSTMYKLETSTTLANALIWVFSVCFTDDGKAMEEIKKALVVAKSKSKMHNNVVKFKHEGDNMALRDIGAYLKKNLYDFTPARNGTPASKKRKDVTCVDFVYSHSPHLPSNLWKDC